MRTITHNNRSAKSLGCPLFVSLLVLVLHVVPGWGVVVFGTVKTAGNEPVPGAEITFTNEDDPSEWYSDVTDNEGGYRIYIVNSTAVEDNDITPSSLQLHQNYPNPFNSSTVIPYSLQEPGHTRIEIYNNLGQQVCIMVDGWDEGGLRSITWDGLDDSGQEMAAGVYIYKLTAGSFAESRKMVLNDGATGRFSGGTGAQKVVIQTDLPTYRVNISGPGLLPYEQGGLVFQEDEVIDFTVQLDTKESIWQMGTPIVAYYHGPGGGIDTRWGPLTHGMAQKLVDGGFNLAWGTTVEDLDVAHAHGLRVDLIAWDLREPSNLDDPVAKARIDALIESVKDHPAMYSYQITDEPSAVRFPEFARMVSYIRERDPAHLAHINLFPTYVSAAALGTSGENPEAYREHLRQFVDIVKPDMISFDHYPLYSKESGWGDGNQYFMNLHLVREASLYGGIPFINVIQAVSLSEYHRIPNGDESRYLGYTTLAYGGQGISHFTYWPYGDFHGGISGFADVSWNAERAAADAAAPLTPLGEAVRQIHPEFVAVAQELQPLTSLAVYHSGRGVPGWHIGHIDRLAPNATFVEDPLFDTKQDMGVLWGYFGSSNEVSHVLVVNLDHGREIRTTVVAT